MSRCKLEEFISYEQPAKYIVDSDQYDDSYETPVLTAGKSFILGYTDEKNNIFDNLPIIIFDDFTTSVQFVDFPFKVKSSAMKLLKNTEQADIKYCYYLLKFLQHTPENHKRQWLSATSQNTVELPAIEEQKNIVRKLDKILDVIDNQNKQLELLDEAIKARFVEMFGNPVSNSKDLPVQKMNNVAPICQYDGSLEESVWLLNLDMVEPQTGRIINYNIVSKDEIGGSVCTFDENNVLYSKLRPYLNKVVIPDGKGYATSELVPLRPDSKIINRIYLAYLLRSNEFVEMIKEKVAGAKMPRVSMSDFREFNVPVPPLELQNQFASFVQEIDKSRLLSNHSLFLIKSITF